MRRLVAGCAALFALAALAGAARSLALADDSAAKNMTATPVYTCPMHPQIQSNQPAACPICGMALKLKTAGQAPSATPGSATSMHINHSQQDAMSMNGCMECMRMQGMGGTNMQGMSGMAPAAPPAGGKVVAPASMRMGGGRGCGC